MLSHTPDVNCMSPADDSVIDVAPITITGLWLDVPDYALCACICVAIIDLLFS